MFSLIRVDKLIFKNCANVNHKNIVMEILLYQVWNEHSRQSFVEHGQAPAGFLPDMTWVGSTSFLTLCDTQTQSLAYYVAINTLPFQPPTPFLYLEKNQMSHQQKIVCFVKIYPSMWLILCSTQIYFPEYQQSTSQCYTDKAFILDNCSK